MENVEVGDIVGWRFSLYNDQGQQAEHHGEVVAIHGAFLCVKSLSVLAHLDPFHSRPIAMCHMVKKKAA